MLIQEHRPPSACHIDHYQAGQIEIDGHTYCQAGLLDGSGSVQTVHRAAASRPEVILIGTGERQQFLHPRIAAAASGVGVECMPTAAAVRTYLLLQNEGRRVWAWLWL